MASKFKITQSGVVIKRGIRFIFGGSFDYSVIIDCQLNGTWMNGFFTWSGAGPGHTAEAQVSNGESFLLRGIYEKIGDSSVNGNFIFSPVSGLIPSNGFIDVNVEPDVSIEHNYFYVEISNDLTAPVGAIFDIVFTVVTNKNTHQINSLERCEAGAGVGEMLVMDSDETAQSVRLNFSKAVSAVPVTLTDNCGSSANTYSKDKTSFTSSTSYFCSGVISGEQCEYTSWSIYD